MSTPTRRQIPVGWIVFMVAICAVPSRGAAAPASFRGLGTLPGGTAAEAIAISADGRVVVGYGDSGRTSQEAFRWSETTGMIELGYLDGGRFPSVAGGVSKDGSVVVGSSWNSAMYQEAFRWTSQGGMVGIGVLPGTSGTSNANAVSADGRTIVGYADLFGGNLRAFRWTLGNGMQPLVDIPEGSVSMATGVSADGSTVVGWAALGPPGPSAVRWTKSGEMVPLGGLPASSPYSTAYSVSGDGRVIVGLSRSDAIGPDSYEPFRWTQIDGMVGLGVLPGFTSGHARGVSLDGTVIVGELDGPNVHEVFIWDAVHGMRLLRAILVNENGLDLSGWPIIVPRCVSASGRVIVGGSVNVDGLGESWIARLPDPPCPADLNCDGGLNWNDIGPFVLALTDTFAYAATFPLCGWARADVNDDGGVDGADIGPFVAALLAGPCP